jgi:hypothetical protein
VVADRLVLRARVNALHEFVPFEPEESEMVRAEIAELADWLGVSVTGLA